MSFLNYLSSSRSCGKRLCQRLCFVLTLIMTLLWAHWFIRQDMKTCCSHADEVMRGWRCKKWLFRRGLVLKRRCLISVFPAEGDTRLCLERWMFSQITVILFWDQSLYDLSGIWGFLFFFKKRKEVKLYTSRLSGSGKSLKRQLQIQMSFLWFVIFELRVLETDGSNCSGLLHVQLPLTVNGNTQVHKWRVVTEIYRYTYTEYITFESFHTVFSYLQM